MQAWILRFISLFIGIVFSTALYATGAGSGSVVPLLLSILVIATEILQRPLHIRSWAPILVGGLAGLGLTALAALVLSRLLSPDSSEFQIAVASFGAVFTSTGVLAFSHRRALPLLSISTPETRRRSEAVGILDTSVIIDGRIVNICRAGFLHGRLVLPRFIMKELQYIADSADTLRRNKGRRGMEALSDLQGNPDLVIEIHEEDFPEIDEVDAKLVALAKMIDAKLVTNDYNLKGIAEIEGIQVLNVNELANAVKPEIIQGETMQVRVIREGKEPGQGVAYLDDGTMVVVDNGKQHMQQSLDVEVTSVLQTSAGRMIFARIRDYER